MRKKDAVILQLLQRLDAGEVLSQEERESLASVTKLDLSESMVDVLPDAVGSLVNLRTMNLRGTGIDALPDSIGRLAALKELDLTYSKLLALPASVCGLSSLQGLHLGGTGIAALPEAIGNLTELQSLNLWETKLTRLPDSLCGLKKLRWLNVESTRITELPEAIGELEALEDLSLEDLTLRAIPRSLALKGLPFRFDSHKTLLQTDHRHGIWCHGLRLLEQEISLFETGPEAFLPLYTDAEKRSVRETRLILLGDGGVGKTYTIQRIKQNGQQEDGRHPYETHETPGVEITPHAVFLEDGKLELYFWDFGGQEILHSMHRCFLTGRTVYLVMVDSRHEKPNARARFWLNNVQSFAKNAPVLLMLNCWDQDSGERLLDDYRLYEEFGGILKGIERVNAKHDSTETFRAFMDRLFAFARGSESCGYQVAAGWDQVRRRVCARAEEEHLLSKETFYEICAECGVAEESIPSLRRWFNILGVSFSFQQEGENEALAKYQLLDPGWLTNALYAIIKEGSRKAREGVIPVTAIEDLLREAPPATLDGDREQHYTRLQPQLRYDGEQCGYILRIAEQFRLAYRIEAQESMFIPALCPEKRPEDYQPAQFRRKVTYEMEYSFLPDSVVHRLMVACRERGDLHLTHCWLHGFTLRGFQGLTAVVQMEEGDRILKIDIYAAGETPAWLLLNAIHEMLTAVNQSLSQSCKEYIIAEKPRARTSDRFSWRQLINSWERRIRTICGDEEEYSVEELLGDIYPKEQLTEQAKEDRRREDF